MSNTTRDGAALTEAPGGLHYSRQQLDKLQDRVADSELSAGELEQIVANLCRDYRVLDNHMSQGDDLRMLTLRFADALYEKLILAEQKYGYSDAWKRDDWQADLTAKLLEHVDKGDPRDVAAYCAFAWHHGWSVSPQNGDRTLQAQLAAANARAEAYRTVLEWYANRTNYTDDTVDKYTSGIAGEAKQCNHYFDPEEWDWIPDNGKRARAALAATPEPQDAGGGE